MGSGDPCACGSKPSMLCPIPKRISLFTARVVALEAQIETAASNVVGCPSQSAFLSLGVTAIRRACSFSSGCRSGT